MRLPVPETLSGRRLDAVLLELLPSSSLRARRRMIMCGTVRVNGRTCSPGLHVRTGDVVEIADETASRKEISEPVGRLLVRQGDFFFFDKPSGLHTVSLAGSRTGSLEAQLRVLCGQPLSDSVLLVQRLDRATSGIVLGVLGREAEARFRQDEQNGLVHKRYVTLVEGRIPSCTVRKRLLTDNRKQTRVLDEEGDSLRSTTFVPFLVFQQGAPVPPWLAFPCTVFPCTMTLAGCGIRAGARHQIRAHAMSMGHPLVSDAQYGSHLHGTICSVSCPGELPGERTGRDSLDGPTDMSKPAGSLPENTPATRYFLHHASLRFPGHSCVLPPAWIEPSLCEGAELQDLWQWLGEGHP